MEVTISKSKKPEKRLQADFAGKRIGFYSYGSGSVSEFFSGVVQDGYKFAINMASIQSMLERRLALSVPQYEQYFEFKLPTDGGELKLPKLSRFLRFELCRKRESPKPFVIPELITP